MRLPPQGGRRVAAGGNRAEIGVWERIGSIENKQPAGADPPKPWWGLMVHGRIWLPAREQKGITECFEEGGMRPHLCLEKLRREWTGREQGSKHDLTLLPAELLGDSHWPDSPPEGRASWMPPTQLSLAGQGRGDGN